MGTDLFQSCLECNLLDVGGEMSSVRTQNLEIPDFQDVISFKCVEFEFMKCLGARSIFKGISERMLSSEMHFMKLSVKPILA
jgi:hypothetical protein